MNAACEEFLQRVSEYLDGGLEPAAAEAERRHALQCTGCGMLLDNLREMQRMLRDERYFPMPEAASARLRQALETGLGEALTPSELRPAAAREAPKPRRWLGGRLAGMPRAAWAAAGILVVLLGVGVIRWRTSAVMASGWLMDSHCYAAFRGHDGDHLRACLLKCAHETYGLVDANGKFHPFDESGKRSAVAALMASHAADHVWVTVKVARSGSATLHVEQLELTAPGSSEFPATR